MEIHCIIDIISETGLLGAKPATSPLEQNHPLALDTNPLYSFPAQYRRLIGHLIYLSFTHPDLAYVVRVLAQFMHQPRQSYWEATLRVVRYLKGSPGQGLVLGSLFNLFLTTWCNSDWPTCPFTRRFFTGWIDFLGSSPISWKSKKQHTVSRSSSEGEYRSMANVAAELKWLYALHASLGGSSAHPIHLYCDSQFALHMAHNPMYHEHTNHIEVDSHCVRDAFQSGLLVTYHVCTTEQLADIFTKALGYHSLLIFFAS